MAAEHRPIALGQLVNYPAPQCRPAERTAAEIHRTGDEDAQLTGLQLPAVVIEAPRTSWLRPTLPRSAQTVFITYDPDRRLETEEKMTDSSRPAGSAAPKSPSGSRWQRVGVWVLAPAFVGGLFIGALIVGLLAGRPTARGPSSAAMITPPPTTTSTTQRTVELVVNDACLSALRDANDLLAQVGQLRDATGRVLQQFSIAPLNDVLQRVDILQNTLRSSFAACQVDVHLPDGSIHATNLFAPTTATPTS